jgi:hypothetical protein
MMFNTYNGVGYVNEFLKSRRPVRVFYNGKFRPNDGESSPGIAAYSIIGLQLNLEFGPCTYGSGVAIGTRTAGWAAGRRAQSAGNRKAYLSVS